MRADLSSVLYREFDYLGNYILAASVCVLNLAYVILLVRETAAALSSGGKEEEDEEEGSGGKRNNNPLVAVWRLLADSARDEFHKTLVIMSTYM